MLQKTGQPYYTDNHNRIYGEYMGGSVLRDKKTGKYYIQVYWEGKRHRIFTHPITREPFYHKLQAQKQLSMIQGEIDKNEFNPVYWKPKSPMLVQVYAEKWLKTLNVSKKTIQSNYKPSVNKYISIFFKDKDIRRIRANDIKLFYKWIQLSEKGKADKTNVLKKMLNDAWRNEDIIRVPPFPRLSITLPEIEYIEFDRQNELIGNIPEKHQPIFYFMQEYGCRVGEARALMKDCVTENLITIKRTFSDNELKEKTKAGDIREFEITDFIQNIFKMMAPHLGQFVFIREDGKRYTNKDLNKIWQPACEKAGLKIKLYNAFRHSLGCQLLDQGEDLDLVRQTLGHKNMAMTRRYAKRKNVKITEAINRRRNVIEFPKDKNSQK